MKTQRLVLLSIPLLVAATTGCSVLLRPTSGLAATYYVSPAGGDGNPCTKAQPCQTIDRGVRRLQAGDTLYLRGGTYTPARFGQHASVPMPSGTSWERAITIASYPGEKATLAGPHAGISFVHGEHYIIFDGIHIDGSQNGGWNSTEGAHHIRFQNGSICCNNQAQNINGQGDQIEWRNNDIHSSAIYGWYWGGTNSLLEGNRIYDNAGYGIHIFSSGSTAVSHNVVRGNVLRGNGFGHLPGGNISGGLIISCGTGNQVLDNVLCHNFAGIQVDYRCTQCVVRNNVVIGAKETAGIMIGSTAVQTTVQDNILVENRYSGIENYSSTSVLSNNDGALLRSTAEACAAPPRPTGPGAQGPPGR